MLKDAKKNNYELNNCLLLKRTKISPLKLKKRFSSPENIKQPNKVMEKSDGKKVQQKFFF